MNNWHPSGKRLYTARELACLQTFPLEHKFADEGITKLRQQIGNAVPPIFYKALIETVVQTLRKADKIPDAIGALPRFNDSPLTGRKRPARVVDLS